MIRDKIENTVAWLKSVKQREGLMRLTHYTAEENASEAYIRN